MQRQKIIIFLGVLILLVFFVIQIGFPGKKIQPSSQTPVQNQKEVVVEGIIVTNVSQTRSLTIDQNGKKIYLLLLEKASLQDKQGNVVKLSDLQKGFVIEAKSKVKGDNFYIVSSLKVTKEPNIIVFTPIVKQKVSSSFTVEGIARVFENVLWVRVKEKTGKILFEQQTQSESPDVGKYGPYAVTVTLENSSLQDASPLVLEVYWKSQKDGNDADVVSIPLQYYSVAR